MVLGCFGGDWPDLGYETRTILQLAAGDSSNQAGKGTAANVGADAAVIESIVSQGQSVADSAASSITQALVPDWRLCRWDGASAHWQITPHSKPTR